MLVLNFVVKM